ncbi:unnamed protein product [Candida verbasci]|uniref:t-SNARE affecting a late Golgi compartment protein 1 n=1 Tax=Candida verbasci TaxID=1227364 RepID=A0A9W4U1U6_9ASCO|nr:unnamed protein product [Candida verbasci]
MDPFNEVKQDADNTKNILQSIIDKKNNSSDIIQDFNNNFQELEEIYEDLKQALIISESQPSNFNLSLDDIANRKNILKDLNNDIKRLKNSWEDRRNVKLRDVTTMSNRISQEYNQAGNPFDNGNGTGITQYQQQELIQEQDSQLDNIHQTMKNLNLQAQIMGNELEDQGYMLDELDYELDNVDNKLNRGLKRMNIFLEKNKETASNWCIGILVVILCILLVLLIIA